MAITNNLIMWQAVKPKYFKIYHNANERKASVGAHRRLKDAGLCRGLPDYTLIWGNSYPYNIGYLEAKIITSQAKYQKSTEEGRDAMRVALLDNSGSVNQVTFRQECLDNYIPYAIFTSVREYTETLARWGIAKDNNLHLQY